MIDSGAILIAVGLLIGNAFFVGAEFALIAARRTQIEPVAANGSKAARLTLRAMERVSLMMADAQLGITMCSLGLGAIGEPAVAHFLEIPLARIGITGPALHTVAFVIALVIVVFLHMVLGEMLPKNIAIATPEKSAMVLGPILYAIVFILRPLIWLMNTVANLVLKLIRVDPREEVASAFTAYEVAAFIAESRDEGLLDEAAENSPIDHRIIRPLATIDKGATLEETLASMQAGGTHFALVVDDDQPVGAATLEDVVERLIGEIGDATDQWPARPGFG